MERDDQLFHVKSNPNKHHRSETVAEETRKKRILRNKDRMYKNIRKLTSEDPECEAVFIMSKKHDDRDKLCISTGEKMIECSWMLDDDKFSYQSKRMREEQSATGKKKIVITKEEINPSVRSVIEFARISSRASMMMDLMKWMHDGTQLSENTKMKMIEVFGLHQKK
jgi:hypothetical protein